MSPKVNATPVMSTAELGKISAYGLASTSGRSNGSLTHFQQWYHAGIEAAKEYKGSWHRRRWDTVDQPGEEVMIHILISPGLAGKAANHALEAFS